MLQKTYEIDSEEYEFDFDKFRALFQGLRRDDPSEGVGDIRGRLAAKVGYSESTIKDWLRGAHSPANLVVIEDLEGALGLSRHELLKPIAHKEAHMITNPRQIEAFNSVRMRILDLLETAEASQYFCWSYDLHLETNALARSLVPTGIDEISGMELYFWLKSAALRELRYQEPYLTQEMKDALLEVIEVDLERIASRDGEAFFYPDPALLPDLNGHESNKACEMAIAAANARTALETATTRFIH